MAPTMELLFRKDAQSAQALVDSGVTKQTESGILYLVIGQVMDLKNQIFADFITAMKAKDNVAKSALSSIKAKITEAEKATGDWKPTDGEVLKVIIKAIKQREESQLIYEKAGREEQALAEASEAAVLRNYLPKPMTEDEIKNVVRSISSDLIGVVPNTQALKGKTIGEFNKQYNGRADVSIVNRIVDEIVGD